MPAFGHIVAFIIKFNSMGEVLEHFIKLKYFLVIRDRGNIALEGGAYTKINH